VIPVTDAASSARTVLVADDSPVVRAAVAKAVRTAGFTVLEAASLEEARAVDARALFAAVLDLDLGDGSGIDAARALSLAQPSLRFAFFTGGDDPPLTARARELAPVFIKPRELDRVLAWLNGLLTAD